MKKAVFMDRDGVINPLVWNPKASSYDSPHQPSEVSLLPGVPEALEKLARAGYLLIVVSNQPSAAKGKCTLKDLENVHLSLNTLLQNAKQAKIEAFYYCYHHPEASYEPLKLKCECRKPGNLSLRQAQGKFNIRMEESWMIGDRDIDVLCGKSMRTRTVLLDYPYSRDQRNQNSADFCAADLNEAAEWILTGRAS